MFFLLYKRADDAVFDNFPKISDHFPKISEDFPKLFRRPDERFAEHFPNISEDFPRITEECRRRPKMFRSYTNNFQCSWRDKREMSNIISWLSYFFEIGQFASLKGKSYLKLSKLILNRPLALRGHVTNAFLKQWVVLLLMPKIDREQKSYLTSEIWEEAHLREIFYSTLIFQQSSMICMGRHVGGHALALQHGGQNCFLLISCYHYYFV